jgi:hypothetical protein
MKRSVIAILAGVVFLSSLGATRASAQSAAPAITTDEIIKSESLAKLQVLDLSEYEGQTIAYGRLNGVIGTGEKFALRKPGP